MMQVIGNIKYIIVAGKVVTLKQIPGTNRYATDDEYKTEFAFENDESADPVTRCGVGFFSLSPDSKYTDACRMHDFRYNSETYQAFHLKSEADEALRRDAALVGRHWVGEIFYKLTRWFGSKFWENKETNK